LTALTQYTAARAALAAATRVDETIRIRDEMEHVKLYARQVKDRALMADATEIQMRAERRLGELLIAAEDAGALQKRGRPSSEKPTNPEGFPPATLEEIGVDYKTSSKTKKAASLSEQAFEAMVERQRDRIASANAITLNPVAEAEKEARDAQRKADHAARTYEGCKVDDLHSLIAAGYKASAILADPPWHFMARSDKGEGRSASEHYTTDRTAEFDAIKALPIKELAANDCVLFMWMVDWCPAKALEVIEAWGFAHKTTAFTWAKLTETHTGEPRFDGVISDRDFAIGQGYWTRANPEDCWLGTRGSPKRINADVRQLVVAPIMEHSRKPDEIHDRIMRLVGGPYLEIYARRPRDGWVTWGNEIPFVMPAIGADGEVSDIDPATGEILDPGPSPDAPVTDDPIGDHSDGLDPNPTEDVLDIPDDLRRVS